MAKNMSRARRQRLGRLAGYRKRQGGYWNYIYYAVVLIASVLSYVMQPSPPKPKPASLEDFDLPSPDEGTPQRVLFGERRCKQWEVLYYGNLRTRPIRSGSGK
jgi:hypothetical protein